MSLQDILKNVAPTIATALGGPLAGAGIKFLAEQFLGDPDATEQQIAQAVEGTNSLGISRLRELDNQFKLEFRKLDTEDYKTEVDDRKSARHRAMEMAKAGIRDYTQDAIAIITILAGFGMLTLYAVTQTVESKEIVLAVVAILTQVYSYYFGSSRKGN